MARAAARGVRQRLQGHLRQEAKLIPLNLEILEAGAQAVRVLEMVARRRGEELGRSNGENRVIKIIFMRFFFEGF